MDQEQLKHVGDALSVGTVVATIAGWLPAVAALVTIVWTGIRIFETQTVQKLLKKFRHRKE
jgi:peptidoglycan biosynthesis protein MviN/MurJ (putative lipid II flippase)